MSDDVTIPAPATRRQIRLRRIAGAMLALLVMPVIAFVTWDRVEASRLSRRLDALYPEVEVAGLAARTDAPTEIEKQAWGLYREAVGQLPQAPGTPFQQSGKIIEALSRLPSGVAIGDSRFQELSRAEDPYGAALATLDRATAVEAVSLDRLDWPFELLYPTRRLANANAVRIGRMALAGDRDGAARALLATLRLRRLPSAPVFGMSLPTTNSLQLILARASVSAETLQMLQRAYTAHPQEYGVEDALVSSRARLAQMMVPEEFGLPARPGGSQSAGVLDVVIRRGAMPYLRHYLSAELDTYDAALEVSRLPWPAVLDAARALGQQYGIPRPFGSRPRSFLDRLSPLATRGAIYELVLLAPTVGEALARTRTALSAIAVERYRRAHAGTLPETLSSLTPEYLPAPLVDPFSGRELLYRRSADSYMVYSVGTNRQDDGGTWEDVSDLQAARRGDPKDLGIVVKR